MLSLLLFSFCFPFTIRNREDAAPPESRPVSRHMSRSASRHPPAAYSLLGGIEANSPRDECTDMPSINSRGQAAVNPTPVDYDSKYGYAVWRSTIKQNCFRKSDSKIEDSWDTWVSRFSGSLAVSLIKRILWSVVNVKIRRQVLCKSEQFHCFQQAAESLVYKYDLSEKVRMLHYKASIMLNNDTDSTLLCTRSAGWTHVDASHTPGSSG